MWKLLKFGLVLAILGIVATVAGFLISADEGNSFLSDADYVKVEDSVAVGSITEILVNMENRKIVLGESTTGNIELVYYESDDDSIDQSVDGNTLSLEGDTKWYMAFMGWMNWFRYATGEQYTVYVNLPAGTEFDVELDTESGAVEVTGLDNLGQLVIDVVSGGITLENLDTTSLTADSTSGSLQLTNITTGGLHAGTTSGSITLTDVTATSISASDVSGRISLTRVTAPLVQAEGVSSSITLTDVIAITGIELETVSGSIDVIRGTTPDLVGQTTDGSIEVSLYGNYTDYFCTFYTTSGSVSVDGESEGEGPHHSGESDSAYLTTVSGSIDLDFLP